LCLLLSIASLFVLASFGARAAYPDASALRGDARFASAPIAATARLATVIPANPLRGIPAVAFALFVAALLVTAALAIEEARRRRRTDRAQLEGQTARMRGPPARLSPSIFAR
jgi:hypothetical protein